MTIEDMESRIREALSRKFDESVSDEAELVDLGGHASLRIYWRITLPDSMTSSPRGESSLLAMVLPEERKPGASEEGPDADQEELDELPFVNVQRYLDGIDVRVPDIDYEDMELGVLLLEDLGDETLEEAVRTIVTDLDALPEQREQDVEDLYRGVVDVLVDFQEAVLRSKVDEDFGNAEACIGFKREFDRETLRWELDHYVEWGLEARLDEDTLEPHRDVLDDAFDRLVDRLVDLPSTLALRDFQSRNLMRKTDEWHLIDFQDALVGPYVYDLVALLRDSYVELAPERLAALVDHYIDQGQARALPWCGDADAVWEAFYLQTIQRKLKDAGRFVYIDEVKDNPDFLEYYEPSIGYVASALDALPGWDDLLATLRQLEPSLEDESH